jgi:hypothetical protein
MGEEFNCIYIDNGNPKRFKTNFLQEPVRGMAIQDYLHVPFGIGVFSLKPLRTARSFEKLDG